MELYHRGREGGGRERERERERGGRERERERERGGGEGEGESTYEMGGIVLEIVGKSRQYLHERHLVLTHESTDAKLCVQNCFIW